MNYYLDEDLSPKIAIILKKNGIDAISAHEVNMQTKSDIEQMEYAYKEKRCMVTRNINDFIKLTVQFFNESRSHYGIIIISYKHPGDKFAESAKILKTYALKNKNGAPSYGIVFL
jgi:hypothetical protein